MSEIETGKLFADKYRIVSLLRESALGDFFRCRHAFTERPAIIQVMHAENGADPLAAARFSDSVKAASHIPHPNILAVTDFGKSSDGQLYASLESIEAETLAEALTRDGRFPVLVALDIARQAAFGLAAAHAAGLVHSSLNTETILISAGADDSRSVKLFDFGSGAVSRTVLDDERNSGREIAYSAPELWCGERPDPLSDVYSLGVVLYEMLAGDVPFIGKSTEEVIKKHTEEAPPPMAAFRADLPAGVEAIVLRALAKHPEMRYQSASEFAEAVDLHGANLKAPAAPPEVSATGDYNIWKTAFVVLAGIALLSTFLIIGTATKRTNPTTILQPDANGMPVQPINPATGTAEQELASMPGAAADVNSNSTMAQPPGTLPGGDGYNPWAGGGAPPPGGPPASYVAPGGQVYTIDPNNPSQFMPSDSGVILVPVPANANTGRPVQPPKSSAANANVQPVPANTAPKSSPTPAAAKPGPSPARTPAKPAANTAAKPE